MTMTIFSEPCRPLLDSMITYSITTKVDRGGSMGALANSSTALAFSLSLIMMSPSYRLSLLPCRVSRLLPPSLSRRQSVLSAAPRRPRRRHAPERLGKKERKKSHPLTLHIYPQCDRALYLSSFPHRDRIRNFASLGRSWANVSLSTSLSVIIV